jgi:hypothetical protein
VELNNTDSTPKATPKVRRTFTRDNEIIRQAKLNFQNAPEVLVQSESLPDFDYDHFPPCWQSLCTEWEGKDLGKFGHVAKKTSRWGRKIASAWFKRKSGYDQIERMQSVYKLKTTHAAAKFLDDRRVHVDKLPIGKHVEKLVKEDPSKQKRVRKNQQKQSKATFPSRQQKNTELPTVDI